LGGLVRSIFGGDSASKKQERLLRKQEADLKAAEAGQRRLREGGRGLLAFVEDEDDGTGGGGLVQAVRRTFRTFGGLS
jgi:hypothetical protein